MGALHFEAVGQTEKRRTDWNMTPGELTIKACKDGSIRLGHFYRHTLSAFRHDDYHVHQIGVLKNVNIVDTTGAGDAFIGGFLLATYAGLAWEPLQDRMNFATWVSGKKLEGVGAQSALPRGTDVDQSLGMNRFQVVRSLHSLVGQQFNSKIED